MSLEDLSDLYAYVYYGAPRTFAISWRYATELGYLAVPALAVLAVTLLAVPYVLCACCICPTRKRRSGAAARVVQRACVLLAVGVAFAGATAGWYASTRSYDIGTTAYDLGASQFYEKRTTVGALVAKLDALAEYDEQFGTGERRRALAATAAAAKSSLDRLELSNVALNGFIHRAEAIRRGVFTTAWAAALLATLGVLAGVALGCCAPRVARVALLGAALCAFASASLHAFEALATLPVAGGVADVCHSAYSQDAARDTTIAFAAAAVYPAPLDGVGETPDERAAREERRATLRDAMRYYVDCDYEPARGAPLDGARAELAALLRDVRTQRERLPPGDEYDEQRATLDRLEAALLAVDADVAELNARDSMCAAYAGARALLCGERNAGKPVSLDIAMFGFSVMASGFFVALVFSAVACACADCAQRDVAAPTHSAVDRGYAQLDETPFLEHGAASSTPAGTMTMSGRSTVRTF